jgi:hypothetical protein
VLVWASLLRDMGGGGAGLAAAAGVGALFISAAMYRL